MKNAMKVVDFKVKLRDMVDERLAVVVSDETIKDKETYTQDTGAGDTGGGGTRLELLED